MWEGGTAFHIYTDLLFLLTPGPLLLHIIEVKTGALVVGRIKPEHAIKDFLRISHPTEAPQAETVSMEAAEKGPIVYASPREKTIKILADG